MGSMANTCQERWQGVMVELYVIRGVKLLAAASLESGKVNAPAEAVTVTGTN